VKAILERKGWDFRTTREIRTRQSETPALIKKQDSAEVMAIGERGDLIGKIFIPTTDK